MVQSCYSVVILLLVSQFGLQVDGKPSDGVPEFRLALERITASMEPENDSKLPDPACVLCAQVANQVLDWFSQGLSRDELVNRTTQLCFTTGIAAEHICYGTIDSYAISKLNPGERFKVGDLTWASIGELTKSCSAYPGAVSSEPARALFSTL